MADASKRPTIVTVAGLAGVSISSASRVLNGHSARPDTISRVRTAAAQVGYVPHMAAQNLKSRRTGQIAFAVENIANPTYVAMVQAIEDVLGPNGYRLVLHSTKADAGSEVEILRDLRRRYVDGLVISPIRVTEAHLREFAQTSAPVVVIGTLPEPANVGTVSVNSAHGVSLAVRHLVEQGCRRIAFLNGPVDSVPGTARLRGYHNGLTAHAPDATGALVQTAADFSVDSGTAAMGQLLARETPDAVICANDLLAIGAMQAVRAHSLSVPDHIAIVGVDDTYLAELVHPALTSVSLHARKRGRLAAELLLERIADPTLPVRSITVEPDLLIRASSRPVSRG